MIKKLLFCLLALFLCGQAVAEPARWLRYPSIAPDGQSVAFSYKGDIYRISVQGGQAQQLTTHTAYDYNPQWSPDGKWIAFNSDREGSQDLWLMPAEGGPAKRLTTHSGTERLQSFSPDGKWVFFTANIQFPASYTQYPGSWLTQLYKVSINGGRTILVLPNALDHLSWNKEGTLALYENVKGSENEWRKHQTSSVARDIWSYDFKTKRYSQLSSHATEDRSPVLSSDEQWIYFLSERSGSFNIWKMSSTKSTQAEAVTKHERHPVRFLTSSRNETLCYAYNGDLYVLPKNGVSTKINVDIRRDDVDPIFRNTLTSGADEAVLSPNGKEVALIVLGDVYVTSVEYGTTKRLTKTPGTERSLTWSPDSRSLAYAAERNGSWDICLLSNKAKEDPYFYTSNQLEETILVGGPTEDFQPSFAPNGKELAFLRQRTQLMVVQLESKKIREVTTGQQNFSYSDGDQSYAWSPDSKWFVLTYMGVKRHPYNDIGLISAEGGAITNLTYSGYMDDNARFAINGNAILFLSDRYGMRSHASWGSQSDVMAIFTNQAAFDKFQLSKEETELEAERQKLRDGDQKDGKDAKKKDSVKSKDILFDMEHIDQRIARLTIHSSDLAGFALTPDGEKLFYLCRVEKGFDLWCNELRKNETKLIEKLGVGSASLELNEKGDKLFVASNQGLFTLDVANTKTRKNISYRAVVEQNQDSARDAMLTHVWRTVSEKFYRTDIHGVDWNGYHQDYAQLLPFINNYFDFSELLSEYLGELNASHTGSGYRAPRSGVKTTAQTGLFFDLTQADNGLLIEEVLSGGPFDRKNSQVRAGQRLIAINGQPVEANTDIFELLAGRAGEELTFGFQDGSKTFEERCKPLSTINELLYQRWTEGQRQRVEKLSDGKLGYAHIRSMNDGSYRTVYSDILGRYNEKEGIVIDTRFNGGGRLHEDVEVLLSGTKYLEQVPRGQKVNNQPTKRWTKPSIMLQCEANYSNAHGTPWVYKTMGIGKLVGMPVPGTMTSVWWESLPEPGLYYGIPIGGYINDKGQFLENQQLEPDFQIANEPDILWKNRDQQVEEAVKILLQDIKNAQDPWLLFDYNKK